MEDYDLFSGFNLLFNEAKEPVAIIDGTRIQHVNKAAKQILGLETGYDFLLLLEKESHKTWSAFVEQSKKEGQSSSEVKFTLKSGKSTSLKARSTYQSSTDLLIVRFDFTMTIPEVLSQINLFDSRFIRIFNTTLTGIILNDENGVIVDANDRACDFLGIQKNSLIGKGISILFDLFPEERDKVNDYILQAKDVGFSQTVFKCNVGHEVEENYYHFTTSRYDKKHLYITIIRDETEKEMMKFQIEHNNSLSTLGQLAASIAHEIRNPMTSLKGFTELLKLSTNEEGKSYLAVIDQELNRMDSILNEFLILSKPLKMDKVLVSIHEIIMDVVNIMQPQAVMKNLLIHFDITSEYDQILMEPNRMKQVLINLIKNAIEVSDEGGQVGIKTELENPDLLKISIIDEGIGLTEHQIEQIFLPFFTTKVQGTGLGLPFVLKTVEEHGGTIQVSSKLGEGTTFYILLPLNQKEETFDDQCVDGILS
ncbi:ATP-binding protein [Chungangia koreensis]|uniref:histidine kinase n=1 Tax=Chungangia koreensis TaxID=752657 RepID=A0ABV8X583_9LACT